MKKLFAFVVLLFIIAVVLFIAGWVQFAVPQGSYGVLQSKTHGINHQVIRGGTFAWFWYRIIPGNTSITVFSVIPQEGRLKSSGELPHAAMYARLTGLKADWSWEVTGTVRFSVKPEALPALMIKEGVDDQNALNRLNAQLLARVTAYAEQRVAGIFEKSTFMNTEDLKESFHTVAGQGTLGDIEAGIAGAFPELENVWCRFVMVKSPDFEMYETAQALYTVYLERQKTLLQAEMQNYAEQRISSQFRFDELTRYGELLTKYPVLLEYLGIENKAGTRKLND